MKCSGFKSVYRISASRFCGRAVKEKGNAVRDGFAVAEGELLMILDADLTMPPEELPQVL
jgi:cellulose synthase/poly-beta-1,6-N-acetylglucosamine synthase-like glycosyltransferase